MTTTETDLTAADVAWDLEPLVDGEGPVGADRLLAEADERAAAFAQRYAGRVQDLDGPSLATAMAELEAIVADYLQQAATWDVIPAAGPCYLLADLAEQQNR